MSPIWVSAVVAALVAATVTWGKEALQAYLRRPKLLIDAEFHDASGQRYFYVRVTNGGQTTARNCVTQLTIHPFGVTRVSNAGLVTRDSLLAGGTASLSDVSTCWQRVGNPIELNIHPGQSQRVEFAATSGKAIPATFTIPSEAGYSQLRFQFEGAGLHCQVRTAADNASSVERWLEVRLSPGTGAVLNLGPDGGKATFALESDPFRALAP